MTPSPHQSPRPGRILNLLRRAAGEASGLPIECAIRHKLDLVLFDALLRDAPETMPATLRHQAEQSLRGACLHNRGLMDELVELLGRLEAVGVRALALKGPAQALLVSGSLRLRRCNDLDLLVHERDVEAAIAAVAPLGYRALPPADGLSRERHLHDDRRGLVVDLHWRLANGDITFAAGLDELWQGRQHLHWADRKIPLAAPPWLLVITALQLVKAFPWVELLYLHDLSALLRRFADLDWAAAREIAGRTGTRRICAASLLLVRDLLAEPIPDAATACFPPDRGAVAAAARLRRVLRDRRWDQPTRYLERVAGLLGHAAFRERVGDKLRAFAALPTLLVAPDSEQMLAGRTRPADRLRKVPEVAATLAAGMAQPTIADLANRVRRAAGALGARVGARLQPSPGVSFHALDDAGVLLSAARREIYGLTPSAAHLWCLMEEHGRLPAMARSFAQAAALPRRTALHVARDSVTGWRELGLIGAAAAEAAAPGEAADVETPVEPPSRFPARPIRRRYRLFDTVIEVAFADAALARRADPALAHFRCAGGRVDVEAAVFADRDGYAIRIDGRSDSRCPDLEAVGPMVKLAVASAATNRTRFACMLHAAMLRAGDACLLLPAAPGSGKTCLSAGLAAAGLAYHSDEVCLLDPDTLHARGLPLALTVKDSGWPILAPLHPRLGRLQAHRRVDDKIVKYLPPPIVPGDRDLDRAWPVRWLVLPRFDPDGTDALVPTHRVEMLQALMHECVASRLRLAADEIDKLVRWLSGIACYRLSFTSLDAGVRLLTELCRPERGHPRLAEERMAGGHADRGEPALTASA